ncbi:MAG: hypothetical protein AB9891_12720 [Anaerolineaceae bacterium]
MCNVVAILTVQPEIEIIGMMFEGVGLLGSVGQFIQGNPEPIQEQTTQYIAERVVILIFKTKRLAPGVGFIGNFISLYDNVNDGLIIKNIK